MGCFDSESALKERLLNEMYAGGFTAFPAMLLDEERILQASGEELIELAMEYGLPFSTKPPEGQR